MTLSIVWMSVDDPAADGVIREHVEPEDLEHARGRLDSVLARALARSLVATTLSDRRWRIRADGRGKPRFLDAADAEGPALSLSHTGNLAAAAVCAGGDLGIDLERRRRRDHSALAAYCFGPGEQAAVAREGEAEFYRIWTLREAFAKATGEGLPRVMDRVDRFAVRRPGIGWTTEADGIRWYFACGAIGLDHCLGVALRRRVQGSGDERTEAVEPIHGDARIGSTQGELPEQPDRTPHHEKTPGVAAGG